jgi:hypothetical protein
VIHSHLIEIDPHRYSLASSTDMGTASDAQPSQLSITSSGTVTFNATGIALGLWTTQIKISDGLAYSVVDFVINVMVCDMQSVSLLPFCLSTFFLSLLPFLLSKLILKARPSLTPCLANPPASGASYSLSANVAHPLILAFSPLYSPPFPSIL